MKTSTLAGMTGLVTGLWTAWFNWMEYSGALACQHEICSSLLHAFDNPISFEVASALGVLLIASSAICLVGPKVVLYASLVFSVLIAGIMALAVALVGIVSLPYLLPTLVLSVASAVLSAVGARAKTSLPPGSHPMDLPVFG